MADEFEVNYAEVEVDQVKIDDVEIQKELKSTDLAKFRRQAFKTKLVL